MPTLLREAVRIVNETLNSLRVEKHPDKTFIGRVERGFDFLGYFLKPGMLHVSISTLKQFAQRITRLYEQGADSVGIGKYVRHWTKWARTGTGTDKILINSVCPSLIHAESASETLGTSNFPPGHAVRTGSSL